MGEALLADSQKVLPGVENALPRFGFEYGEQADAKAKTVFGGDFVFAVIGETGDQFLFTFGGKGVNFAGLTALPGGLALADPLVFHEAAKQRIDEVVVHLAPARDEPDVLFERVAVLRTREQGGEEQ